MGVEVNFSYVSGYNCLPGNCPGAPNVSVVVVDAFNQSVVAELWRSPALNAYSYDHFKGYSPPVTGNDDNNIVVAYINENITD